MMETKAVKTKKTKTADPAIIKQRRETVEKRIVRLEGKLSKDRALLLRYAEVFTSSD